MKKILIPLSVSMLLSMTQVSYAGDDSATKQIQMLNSQIQSQIQQMQEAQKKKDKIDHEKYQAQLKQIQTDIQKQITTGYAQTQDQIKKVQDTLQTQIKQVKTDVENMAKVSAAKKD